MPRTRIDEADGLTVAAVMHAKFTTLPATATIRDLALLTDTRRVPVVDHEGRLLGVVAVTGDLQSFCGTG